MLKVVHIQYSASSATAGALKLHKAFNDTGIHSKIISFEMDPPPIANVIYLGKKHKLIKKVNALINFFETRKIKKEFGKFSHAYFQNNLTKISEIQNADIIYIHWTQDLFLSFKSVEKLAALKKPLVFLMHDMSNITGGCHQSYFCKGYLSGCNNCPMFEGLINAGLPEKNFKNKLRFYSTYDNVYFIANSKWLYSCTRQSLLTNKKQVFYLPDIAGAAIFKSFDKQTARSILSINANERVIVFETYTINAAYGGFDFFKRSIEILQKQEAFKNICVLIMGNSDLKEATESLQVKTKVMGYLYDDYSKALVYNAADVFVLTSIADEGSALIQESLSCGLPVVAFDMAGIQDIITHKKNGYIAKYKDVVDLEEGIRFCLNGKIMDTVKPIFTDDQIIKRHVKIFDRMNKK